MTGTHTRTPSGSGVERRVEVETISSGRMWALLVAALSVSLVASLLVSNAAGAPAPAPALVDAVPAATEDPAPAQPEPREAAPIVRPASDIPDPIGDRGPTTVEVALETVEKDGQLADGTVYTYWTFGGSVPGPMIRVREGDTVELHLSNSPDSSNIHSIDLHAVNGPGGGGEATQTAPGEERRFTFAALNPGVYVYHCATPHIPSHIANGMYGLIVVEPQGGLAPVDRELYVVQGEIYTAEERGTAGLTTYDGDRMMAEDPTYVVFNGAVNGLSGDRAMRAKVGETVRIFVGNGGPNLTSSFHVIGEIFDTARVEGGSLANHDVQTTVIPAGGATWVEFTIDAPGDYLLVDHAIARAVDGGALATITASGPADPAVFDAPEAEEGGPGPHAAGAGHQAAPAATGTVEAVMTEFAFDLSATEIPAAAVTLTVRNDGVAPHELVVAPADAADDPVARTEVVDPGASTELTVDLAAGDYEIACHIPGHYESGMRAPLTVR